MKLQIVTSCGSCLLPSRATICRCEALVSLGVFVYAQFAFFARRRDLQNCEQSLGQGLVVNLRSGTLMRGTGISLGGVTQRLNHAIARHLLLFLAHKRKHLVLGVRKCVIMQLC